MANQETYVQRLCEILVQQEAITQEEATALEKVFEQAEEDQFDAFLLDQGSVTRDQLLKALSVYYEIPAFDAVGYFFTYHQLHKFPKGFLLRNGMIPLEVDENIMVVVVSDPEIPDLLTKIGEHVSYDIRFRVGLKRDICDAVKEFYDRAPTEVAEDGGRLQEQSEHDQVEDIAQEEEVIRYSEED